MNKKQKIYSLKKLFFSEKNYIIVIGLSFAIGMIAGKLFFTETGCNEYVEVINAVGTLIAAVIAAVAISTSVNIARTQSKLARIETKERLQEEFEKFFQEFNVKGRNLDESIINRYRCKHLQKSLRHFPGISIDLKEMFSLLDEIIEQKSQLVIDGKPGVAFNQVGRIGELGNEILAYMSSALDELESTW